MEGRLEQFPAPDGRILFCHDWRPAGAVRGRVVFLHGIESHAGWFQGTCRWLSRLGFHVVALERRGSGADARDRGDIHRYRTWMDDVQLAAERLSREHPPAKIHLMGVSWGGKLAAACAALRMPWISSLILVAPGLAPKVDVPVWTKAQIGLSYLFRSQRRFALPIGSPSMFTPSEHWKEFIQGDPLRLKEVTARFLIENRKLDRFIKNNLAAIRVPAFLLLAQKDDIIDNGRTRDMFGKFGSPVRKVVEYPGTTHTLEFEQNPDIWRADVLSWLDARALEGSNALV